MNSSTLINMKNHQSINSKKVLKNSIFRTSRIQKVTPVLFIFLLAFSALKAQENSIENKILEMDAVFWKAYNSCNVEVMNNYLAEDIEFYHDNGGIEMGRESLNKGLKNGLCSTGKNNLRREAIEKTIKVFPMKDNGTVYGAIINGEHLFYPNDGKSENPEGQAKFSHLWLLKDGEWKMHRVFSYDHGPTEFVNSKKTVQLNEEELDLLTGDYLMPNNEVIKVTKADNILKLEAMGKTFELHPESNRKFFTKKRNLAFSFSEGSPVKVKIYEGENLVAEATRSK